MCPHSGHFSVTFSSASFASCSFVCVLPFCLSGEGNASGCERVTISMFSYAAQPSASLRLGIEYVRRTARGLFVAALLAGDVRVLVLGQVEQSAAVRAEEQ